MKKEILAADAPEKAHEMTKSFFVKDRLNCAESVLKSLLTLTGMECPPEVQALACGFGRGMGGAGCTCGALVGGVMAIGTLFGQEKVNGFPAPLCFDLCKEMHDSFKKEQGATCCRVLHRGHDFGTKEQLSECAERAAQGARLAARIIADGIKRRETIKKQL